VHEAMRHCGHSARDVQRCSQHRFTAVAQEQALVRRHAAAVSGEVARQSRRSRADMWSSGEAACMRSTLPPVDRLAQGVWQATGCRLPADCARATSAAPACSHFIAGRCASPLSQPLFGRCEHRERRLSPLYCSIACCQKKEPALVSHHLGTWGGPCGRLVNVSNRTADRPRRAAADRCYLRPPSRTTRAHTHASTYGSHMALGRGR
jgi:hypothetical protein